MQVSDVCQHAELTFMSRSGEEEPLPLMTLELAHVTHSQHSRGAAQAARAVCVRRATATAALRPPPHHEPPPLPAASFLTIICVLLVFYHHYSLVLFYVLSSASRSHRPPCAPSAAQIIAACNYRRGRELPSRTRFNPSDCDTQRHLVTRSNNRVLNTKPALIKITIELQ